MAPQLRSVYLSGGLVFACVALGAVVFIIDLGITRMRPQFLAWYSSAAFVFTSFIISVVTIWGHFLNYRSPRAQNLIVRIIVVVPLYSTTSWLSLRFHDLAFFFGALRDCYEVV